MRDNRKSKGRRFEIWRMFCFFFFFLHWNHNVNEAAITVEFKGRESCKTFMVCRGMTFLMETFDFSWK